MYQTFRGIKWCSKEEKGREKGAVRRSTKNRSFGLILLAVVRSVFTPTSKNLPSVLTHIPVFPKKPRISFFPVICEMYLKFLFFFYSYNFYRKNWSTCRWTYSTSRSYKTRCYLFLNFFAWILGKLTRAVHWSCYPVEADTLAFLVTGHQSLSDLCPDMFQPVPCPPGWPVMSGEHL